MRRFSLRTLLVAATLALPLSFGGMQLGSASAAPDGPGTGVGAFCQQNLQAVDYAVGVTLLEGPLPFLAGTQPPTLTVGACASLLTGVVNGTYATSAPYVGVCRNVASSYGITDPSFQGQCVAFFSTSGFKYLVNYFSGMYFFGGSPPAPVNP